METKQQAEGTDTEQYRMSGRQSLYGQSLVRNASAANLTDAQDKHWKRDWVTPLKTAQPSSTVTPSGTPTPFGDERDTQRSEQQQKYTFKVKAWVLDLDYKAVVDGDDGDVLDLDQFSSVKKEGTSGLSDDAIRGAVGSESVLAGLSKSVDSAIEQAAEPKLEEIKEEASVSETTPFTETSAEVTPVIAVAVAQPTAPEPTAPVPTAPEQVATVVSGTLMAPLPNGEVQLETTAIETPKAAQSTQTPAEIPAVDAAVAEASVEQPEATEATQKQDADGDVVM